MIGTPNGVRVLLACGVTDPRNGFDGLSGLARNPNRHFWHGNEGGVIRETG